MAAKKSTNGHDSVTQRMADLLESIDGRLNLTNNRLDTLRGDVIKGLDELRQEMRGELTDIRGELHEMNEREVRRDREGRDDRRDHEARLAKLEEVVFRKTG